MENKNSILFKYMPLSPGERPLREPIVFKIPPYCPNPDCQHHLDPKSSDWYLENGTTKTLKYPGVNQRFLCKHCKKSFSSNTFSMDFRKRHIGLGPLTMDALGNGKTIRSTAEVLGLSEMAVRRRIKDLAKQALIRENQLTKDAVINEAIAYDGFESFCGSQFSPNYINTAVGSESLFTYSTTYSPLNRKGKMTDWQKSKNEEIQKQFGKYPTDSVREETQYIFEKLCKFKRGTEKLLIWTDEHKSYLSALSKMKNAHEIIHKTISSKARRDALNPLFPVNHLHLLKRHFNSAHRRETISFHKNEAGLMDRVTINRIHKNYFRSKHVKKTKRDPRAALDSPAMKIGICNKILNFEEFFDQRRVVTQCDFDQKEYSIFNREYPFSRSKIA